LDRGERLFEAPLDRLVELAAQLLELVEAAREVGALGCELLEPLALGSVLLLRERIDLAQLRPAAQQPFAPAVQLADIVELEGVGAGLLEPAAGLGLLGLRAR